MVLVDTILTSINTIVDKIFPDATVREQVKAQLATQALDWYKLEAADRDSARKRESDTKDSTTATLAWVYTLGYFGMLGSLLMGYVNVPTSQEPLLDVLMGVLTAGQYSIMAYYFGSSSGSANKDRTIDRVVNHKP